MTTVGGGVLGVVRKSRGSTFLPFFVFYCNHINRMIRFTVITFSGIHCRCSVEFQLSSRTSKHFINNILVRTPKCYNPLNNPGKNITTLKGIWGAPEELGGERID